MGKKLSLSALLFLAALGWSKPAISQYSYETLRPRYGSDINGNPTYRDSSGTTYRHTPMYDPNGIGSYRLRGSDGSTLTCRRGYSKDTCE